MFAFFAVALRNSIQVKVSVTSKPDTPKKSGIFSWTSPYTTSTATLVFSRRRRSRRRRPRCGRCRRNRRRPGKVFSERLLFIELPQSPTKALPKLRICHDSLLFLPPPPPAKSKFFWKRSDSDSSRKNFNLVFAVLSQMNHWRCCFVVAMSFVLEVRRDGKRILHP